MPLGFVPMMLCSATGFTSYILDRPHIAFIFVTFLCQLYSLLLLCPSIPAFICLFLIFVMTKQFMFSVFFTYTANTFGFDAFGRIVGVASTCAGLLQLSQGLLFQYVESNERTGGWMGWKCLDLIMGLAPACLLVYPILCIYQTCYTRRLSCHNATSDPGSSFVEIDMGNFVPPLDIVVSDTAHLLRAESVE